jgi:hypothetical protein
MMDSIAFTNIGTDVGVESLVFYAIVAANTAGTSGDEPSTELAAAPEF